MPLLRFQLILGSLLSVLPKALILFRHFISPPVHLPNHHRSLFGGKGQAKDLKQALLGRQPKLFTAFKKKKKELKKVGKKNGRVGFFWSLYFLLF